MDYNLTAITFAQMIPVLSGLVALLSVTAIAIMKGF
jgi:hypothetical protein